ncbi:MAG: CDP-alcohol phosphatidyltransferase family protein [Nanoarchaeota archaeon]|nr:CDP-alcohol phosphatidyltransferase family protein [Nanoarchaeota archaeon]
MVIHTEKNKKGFFSNIESKITDKLLKSKGTRHDEEDTHILRKFSRLLDNWVASKLVKTKITPNQVTFISLISALFSAFFFALASHLYVILGTFFFLTSHILDGVDGSLARLKGMGNKYGSFLDHIVGIFIRPIIFFFIAWGVFSINNNYLTWVFAYSAITSLLVNGYIQNVFLHDFSFSKDVAKNIYRKFSFLMLFRYTVWFYLPVMLFFAIINNMYLFLLVFGIYGPLYAIAQTCILAKKVKKHSKQE